MKYDLQQRLMYSMMQDIITSGQWTANYCEHLIHQFEKIYPGFRKENKGSLETQENNIEILRKEEREKYQELTKLGFS